MNQTGLDRGLRAGAFNGTRNGLQNGLRDNDALNSMVVKNGLVMYLDAGIQHSYQGQGTRWFDLTANGNNATLVNGPTYNSVQGGSIQFDGVNDYVNTVDTPLRFGNQFTFTVWFYWNGVNVFAAIAAKRNGTILFTQYGFSILDNINTGGASNKITFIMIPTSGSQTSMAYVMPSAGWYQATAVVMPNEQRLYINGTLRVRASNNFSSTNFNVVNRNLLIGATWNDAGNGILLPYNDKIASVMAYSRSLTEQEVKQNYNATKSRFGL